MYIVAYLSHFGKYPELGTVLVAHSMEEAVQMAAALVLAQYEGEVPPDRADVVHELELDTNFAIPGRNWSVCIGTVG